MNEIKIEQSRIVVQNLGFKLGIHMMFASEATDDPNPQVHNSMAKGLLDIHTWK